MRSSMKHGARDSASVGCAMKLRGSARILARNASRSAAVLCGPIEHAVAARLAHRLHDQRVEVLEHVAADRTGSPSR